MIKTLTPEQIAMEEVFCQKWIQRALNTERIDPAKAEIAVRSLYTMLGEPMPKFEIHDGPIAAWKRVCEIATNDPAKRAELEKNIVLPLIDGVINAGYYAYLDFLDYIGVKVGEIEEVKLYRTLAEVAWVWPMEGICILSENPSQIHIDGDGNLHNESGPSVAYRDGLTMWDINGIQVDEQIVMDPSSQTIKQILNDSNADRQAIRIERFGWLPFLKQTNAKVLDERTNDVEGTYEVLYETTVGNLVGNRLVGTCPTGKIPVMGVPTRIRTCEEAQFWLGGDQKVNVVGRT